MVVMPLPTSAMSIDTFFIQITTVHKVCILNSKSDDIEKEIWTKLCPNPSF